uniref:Uncharacterized protein n=1 Tax=Meloidogyne hapla TaxID=6305 RepID=A0A1I8BMK9_MELHA
MLIYSQVIPTHQQQQYQPLRVVSCDSSDTVIIAKHAANPKE